MFAANALGWWGPQIREGQIVRWPYLAVPTAPIHERDIAAVAVRALCEKISGRWVEFFACDKLKFPSRLR